MGIPSAGQLVTVRQRRFVVTNIVESALGGDLRASLRDAAPEHLVSLQSVEEDGDGEELTVVWELEPGARTFERATMPDPTQGFDAPDRLDAFLDAVRWGAVASADVRQLYAPFRSGIAIEDYQLDPVVRALQMPRANLLIADDVGLGKTIEAGLVLQELLLRHRAHRILVVCPAGLCIQWRDQMRDKFGLEFRIVDSELMRDLRRRRGIHVNPWTHFPRLITSIDFLKRDRPMRLFREVLPAPGEPAFPRRFDVLVVDEAHNVAPSGRGNYAEDSNRTRAVRTLAPHFEHKLFLTATPHNGYSESFAALLELLDDQRFCRGATPDKAQLGAVMVRRLKSELPKDDLGRDRFAKRVLTALPVPYTPEEVAAHADLQLYAELRRKGAEGESEELATEFVLKLLKKRLFSSPEAFRITLERHEQVLREGKVKGSKTHKPVGILRREVQGLEEESADDATNEAQNLDAVDVTSRVFRPLSSEEEQVVARLLTWARGASGRADSKARELIRWVESIVRPGGQWSDQRVLLFTEYRATQNWLADLLAAHGLTSNRRLEMLYGGMPSDEREKVKAAFQAGPKDSSVRILLATDAASEGIDLQNHCSRLLHYEIPWNPNRMEQRNGRVDRHGQKAKEVQVFHFVAEGYSEDLEGRAPGDLAGDLEFLMRAAIKVEKIREDLGNVGDVIARRVEEAMLGKRRTLGEPERDNRRADAAKSMLKFERKLKEQLARLKEELRTSREELGLSPASLRAVVDVGLQLAGFPPLKVVKVPGPEGEGSVEAFLVPPLSATWAPCAEGLLHPHTQNVRPITFDHALAAGRDDVVLAHLNHRLVLMCLRLLRAEIWAPEGVRKLNRVSARVVSDADVEHPLVVVHGRLVLTGADSTRLHEEVLFAGGMLREGRFRRLPLGDVKTVLSRARGATQPVSDAVRERLAALWPSFSESLTTALDAQAEQRAVSLKRALADRAEKEAQDLTFLLEELRRHILSEINEKPPIQLDLFSPQEKEQLASDKDALRRRADAVPAEIERETAAIRARYADVTPRLFPVAVTYLVPARLARA